MEVKWLECVKIDCVESRTAWVTVLFSFWYPPTVSCRAVAPSSWKEVKSVTGFSLTQFPVVSYFLLHLITCSPKWFMFVCGSACTCLCLNTACVQVGKAQNSHDVFSVLDLKWLNEIRNYVGENAHTVIVVSWIIRFFKDTFETNLWMGMMEMDNIFCKLTKQTYVHLYCNLLKAEIYKCNHQSS